MNEFLRSFRSLARYKFLLLFTVRKWRKSAISVSFESLKKTRTTKSH